MVSEKMSRLGSNRSCIRELFEFGRKRAAVVGAQNVCDFSLGNPSVPAPAAVTAAMHAILDEYSPVALHGYTSAPGCDEARDAIALSLNKRYNTSFSRRNIYITCGAAPALTACFKGLTIDENTEFVAIAPFFPEYACFANVAGGKLVVVPADIPDFQINFDALCAAINENTQAVIINSPNNPSGVVYTEETIKRLAELLSVKERELGRPLYLITDEPYRELVYDGIELPFVTGYYNNTIMCYSYSKSLSLPGERIGYVLVADEMDDFDVVCDAITGASRSMGHVCAPSFLQRVIARCADVEPDLAPYIKNRDALYEALCDMGYRCAKPSGAFYLFVEAPNGDARTFSDMAKAHDLLIVPGNDFGCPTYVRISYCVAYDTIMRALPAFKLLIDEIKAK